MEIVNGGQQVQRSERCAKVWHELACLPDPVRATRRFVWMTRRVSVVVRPGGWAESGRREWRLLESQKLLGQEEVHSVLRVGLKGTSKRGLDTAFLLGSEPKIRSSATWSVEAHDATQRCKESVEGGRSGVAHCSQRHLSNSLEARSR